MLIQIGFKCWPLGGQQDMRRWNARLSRERVKPGTRRGRLRPVSRAAVSTRIARGREERAQRTSHRAPLSSAVAGRAEKSVAGGGPGPFGLASRTAYPKRSLDWTGESL